MPELLERLQQALAGRYRIGRELGQGAMAVVYLAEDLKHHRLVALKVLRPELTAALGPERFLREIELTAQLTHPHILPLHDSGEANGLLYYVMPYVEGETLRDRLTRETQLPLDDALQIFREVADALSYAHGHGVIHRDIKPENILFEAGHAVVADFGIAKALSAAGGARMTGTGLAVGTPAYMSPEQAAANSACDHRTDLYALGVVAYEMLAGRTPFAGENLACMLASHAAEPPQSVVELRPECAPALTALVMRCLEKSPEARPQRAEEIVGSLDATLVLRERTSLRHARRRPRGWALVTLGVAGLLVVLGAAAAFVPAGTRATLLTIIRRPGAALMARRVLVAPFSNQTGDTTLEALGAMAADWIGQGLSGVAGAEIVDPRTALGTQKLVQSIPWPLRTRDATRAMANEVGAGTLVSGTIYREGDTLLFLAKITDLARGRLVRALAPVRASRATPLRALAELQQRVAGSLAQVNETTGGTSIGSLAEPPSLEAYEEVYRGMEAYFRADDSGQFVHLERAARLDTTYTTPLVFLALARTYHLQYAVADSVVRRAERLGDRLSPAERALLDHLEAFIRGDRDEAMFAAERFTALMPGSHESPLLLASVALSVQAPKLALTALARIDPERGLNLVAPVYWNYQAIAAAELGDWERSLAMAREGQRRFPQSPRPYELAACALARLGRVSEMEQAISRLPAQVNPLVKQAALAVKAWGALRAAGLRDAAQRLMTRYASMLDAVAADTSRETSYTRGRVLWRAGRVAEAGGVFAGLTARDSGVERLRDLAQLGITMAMRGDRTGALSAEREIAAANLLYQRGTPKLLQAEIAAALGQGERAVALLQRGLALGLGLESLGGVLLDNPDLEPLFGFAPFQALLKPAQ